MKTLCFIHRRLLSIVKNNKSKSRVVQSDICIKAWRAETPDADEARPKQCPSCRAAGRPVGGKRGLWGHGTRRRQVRGPLSPGEESGIITVCVRRYQCQRCETAMTVVPRGILTGRYYSGSAVGWAAALYGIAKQALHEVRRAVCAWRSDTVTEHDGWPTLRLLGAHTRLDKSILEPVQGRVGLIVQNGNVDLEWLLATMLAPSHTS
ncbi:MAG: hypothetical protein MJE77_18030 [Proteobacteria bacterium]|nr:hypothetical protein [Pseudomonadota bacterium]